MEKSAITQQKKIFLDHYIMHVIYQLQRLSGYDKPGRPSESKTGK